MNEYYKKWRLKFNPSKNEVSAFHLNNKLADKKLDIKFNGMSILHNGKPKYLGVWLDRSLIIISKKLLRK